jgi:hypothetical protein
MLAEITGAPSLPGQPFPVALEATVIAHGLPWPLNLETARGIIGEYLTFVNGDALMADIDDNGFTPVAVRDSSQARSASEGPLARASGLCAADSRTRI